MELTLTVSPRLRRLPPWRRMAWGLVFGVLLLGGWLWVRDSSLVAVSRVQIEGVRGVQAPQIDALLRVTARRMTTMDFDGGALLSAVESFPLVKRLHVSTGFPHTVRISVIERPPVAVLQVGSQRTAVAADGVALGPELVTGSLPLVTGSFAPLPGQRVSDAGLLAAVSVLGAVPPQLERFVARAFMGREGLTLAMHNGLLVYFGDSTRAHAKWLSLARVLSDPSAASARYVDVRVPERPAAGLAETAGTSTTPGSPTAALAERLEQTLGGGAGSFTAGESSPAAGESSSTSGEGPSATGEGSSTGGESSSAAGSSTAATSRSSASEAPGTESSSGEGSATHSSTAPTTGGSEGPGEARGGSQIPHP